MSPLWPIVTIAIAGLFSACSKQSPMNTIDERTPGMDRYDYRSCDGGPHIVLPLEVAAKWKGDKINMLNPLDPKTDYGRACNVPGKWGLIKVAGSDALVLANPPMTAIARVRRTNVLDIFVLQAWDSDDLDSLLDRASANASTDSFTNTGAIMRFDGSGAVLLFAGDKAGDATYGESRLALNAGDYKLFTAHYRGTGVEEVDIYRLTPRAQP